MIATVVLSNTGAAILYSFALVGLWHIIGIPPIKDWFKKKEDD